MNGNPFLVMFGYIDGYAFDLGTVEDVFASTLLNYLPDGTKLPEGCRYVQYPANTAADAAMALLFSCGSFRDKLKYFYCIGHNPVLGAAFTVG